MCGSLFKALVLLFTWCLPRITYNLTPSGSRSMSSSPISTRVRPSHTMPQSSRRSRNRSSLTCLFLWATTRMESSWTTFATTDTNDGAASELYMQSAITTTSKCCEDISTGNSLSQSNTRNATSFWSPMFLRMISVATAKSVNVIWQLLCNRAKARPTIPQLQLGTHMMWASTCDHDYRWARMPYPLPSSKTFRYRLPCRSSSSLARDPRSVYESTLVRYVDNAIPPSYINETRC